MSKKDDTTYVMELSPLSTQAAWWLMVTTDCKARSEARLTRKVLKSLKANAMKMTDEFNGNFEGGEVVLTTDPLEHLRKCADKKFEKGVEGRYAEGVDELLEMIEEVKIAKLAEKKAAEKDIHEPENSVPSQ